MPLFNPVSNFRIENLEQYNDLFELIDRQIDMVCSGKTVVLTKIAVREALNNAIEHGAFPVHIEFTNLPTRELVIKVTDQGQGFLAKEKIELIRKKGADLLLDERGYEERGRGIYIMFKAVNQVIFNDKGNEVSLVISN